MSTTKIDPEHHEVNMDDFRQQIEMVCIERGLEIDEVVKALEQAIASAYRKEIGDKDKAYEAKFDLNTAKYSIYEVTTVVEEVEFPTREISLIDAKLSNSAAQVGDKIVKEVEIDNQVLFGRIASQVAKQVAKQSINSIRHSKVLQQFKDRIGDIVNVEIDYFKKGGYVVKLAQTTGYLNREDLTPIDRFKSGQIVKALIVDISEDARGNSRVVLSRTSPDFVAAILRTEIPEIEAGIVNIEKIAREPGARSKILVSASEDESVDPVGTILGKKNVRIINVMREISTSMQEKVDIIEYNPDDFELMVIDALEPAEIEKVEINKEEHKVRVHCYPEEAALAVGRRGVNIKLASQLLEYDIEVVTLEDDGQQSTNAPIVSLEDEEI